LREGLQPGRGKSMEIASSEPLHHGRDDPGCPSPDVSASAMPLVPFAEVRSRTRFILLPVAAASATRGHPLLSDGAKIAKRGTVGKACFVTFHF